MLALRLSPAAKSLFKVLVIGYFLYAVIRDNMKCFPGSPGTNVGQSTVILGNMLLELAWKAALAF
jgi:flagellar biosynthetic protein FlhB